MARSRRERRLADTMRAPRTPLLFAWLASVAWIVALVCAPAILARGPAGLARTLGTAPYVLGNHVCHQRTARSFHVLGVPMPVCARCTGVYAGVPIGLAAALWSPRPSRRRRPISDRAARLTITLAALPTLCSVVLEILGVASTPGWLRLALALPLAALTAWILAERLDEGGART